MVPNVRHAAGLFRYGHLFNRNAEHPLIALLEAAPPWLLSRTIEELFPSGRTLTVLTAENVRAVSDLRGYSIDDFRRLPKFGSKRIEDVSTRLVAILGEGPLTERIETHEGYDSETLIDKMHRWLSELSDHERDIVVRRMGLHSNIQTLQEIADRNDLSRERIRQIEARTIRKLMKLTNTGNTLTSRLDSLLKDRKFPIPVHVLESSDDWFAGIVNGVNIFRYVLRHRCGSELKIDQINGEDYLFHRLGRVPGR